MLLCVDIGNTNITSGIFNLDKFLKEFRFESNKDLSVQEYINLFENIKKDYNITDIVIASVVDELTNKIFDILFKVFKILPFVLDSNNAGINIIADNINEVGADRIANVLAVIDKYDKSVIILDFGTATTFDIINSKKEFCGGIIIPGVKTQLNSLKLMTSKLPYIEPDVCDKVIVNNTKDAILSGVIRGSACAIDGLINECEKELKEKPIVIATGGYANLITSYMTHKIDDINPILTLEGLRQLHIKSTQRFL